MDVLGIDLAKLTFDATLLVATGAQHYASFANTPEGFIQLAAWLAEHNVTTLHACTPPPTSTGKRWRPGCMPTAIRSAW